MKQVLLEMQQEMSRAMTEQAVREQLEKQRRPS
jgi:hypothetical protein